MSRHHPYGGYDGPPRRGGAPHGPGPERTFRFERGGGRGGRGRGGGPPSRGGFNNFGAHNAPPPSPGPAYDGYGNGAPPYPGSGGGGGGDPFYNDYPPPPDNYDGYEDAPGRGGPPQPRRRREREDQVHDSLIEQRIQRERPCRTLFIRNIKYETDSNHVRSRFLEFGEIKSFYDLISSRGMVFVTYYDLRAAERARDRLQGTELAGRPIDVHYSLPRADEQNGRCDRDKNQGTLLVSLRSSASGQPIDEHELRRKFQQFGDVKAIKPAGSPTDRYVEMYDTRTCELAHDKLRRQSLQDGEMEIEFAWDIPDHPLPPGPIPRRHDTPPRDDFRGRGGRGRGGPGRGRGGRGGFSGDREYRDDMDPRGRDNWDARERERRDMDVYNRDREPPPRPHHGGYNSGPAPPMPPPQNYPMYPGSAPPPPPPQDDRLEQAKKVQQLLEALKGPGAAAATPAPPTPAQAPAPVAPRQHMPPPPPAAGNPYYPPPPQPASYPQAPAYSQPPAPVQYPGYSAPPPIPAPAPAPVQAPPPPAQSTAPALPANIMALLQSQQAPTPPPTQVPQYGVPAPVMNHTGYPPPTPAAMAPPAPTNSASQVQQLMALLQKRA